MGELIDETLYANNIYLIGTAEKGPVNVPILAKSLEHIRSIFGDEGTLFDAYSVVDDAEVPCNVYLCKTSGSHSELYLNILQENGEIIENGFFIKSRHANEFSDNIEIYLDDNVITFTYPEELGANVMSYDLNKYYTLHELAAAINEDTKLQKGEVFCSAFCEPHITCKYSLAPVNATNLKLTGGNSGLYYNKNMMYNCMTTTYSVLEGHPTDIVVPLQAYFDDTLTDDLDLLDGYSFDKDYLTLKSNGSYLSFYRQLLDFCRLQMQSAIISHGVMGMSATNDIFLDEEKYLTKLDIFKKVNEIPVELEKYAHMISVVAQDVYSLYGTLNSNGYVAYATLIAATKISETTTNKALPISFVLYNTFEQVILESITSRGFVCFRNSPLTNCVHVVSGVTLSNHNELKYLCNVRMIQVVMKNIKSVLSKYIGTNIDDLIESGAINEEMSDLLTDLSLEELVKDFSSLNVIRKNDEHLMVELSFATKYMVEEIKTYSGLSAVGDVNGI